MIDLDSQATATTALGAESSDAAADVLLGRLRLDDGWRDTASGVRLLGSGPGTEGAERLLAADPVDWLMALRRAIDAATDVPQLILIDIRPDEAHGVLIAYVAANEVWIVTEPVPASIEVIPRLINTVKRIANSLNPGLTVTAISPTKVDARTRVHGRRPRRVVRHIRHRDPARSSVLRRGERAAWRLSCSCPVFVAKKPAV